MISKKSIVKIIAALFICSFLFSVPSTQKVSYAWNTGGPIGAINLKQIFEAELPTGEYFTIKDERDSKVVTITGRYVHVGDELITKDNDHYRVSKVSGNVAYAKFLGVDESIVWKPEWDEKLVSASTSDIPVQGNGDNNRIAIYHTHSSESYVPTDGSESIPSRGGIFKVGTVLSKQLERNGAESILSLRPHDPHDANAYQRSRRTAMQLLKQQPAAIIDVHRDGVPDPEFYRGDVEEEDDATSIRLVVGRQNANMEANLEFAKNIKAFMDREKPGLIKEIFMAKGNYNQDLSPRAILIEAGTHTNRREEAQKSMAIFAEALPQLLGIEAPQQEAQPAPGPGGPATTATDSPASWSSLWWILGAVIVGGGAFLLISTGSVGGAKEKFGQFFTKEWSNALGVRKNTNDVKDVKEDNEEKDNGKQ